MTIKFTKEHFGNIMHELPPILVQHFNETPDGDLDPDWENYLRMDAAGALHILTVRDEGIMVGYFFALIQNHLHDKKKRVAYVNLWYVLPEYRDEVGGYRLLRAGEKMLKALHVSRVNLDIPTSSNISFIPASLGYTLSSKGYRKDF